MSLVWIYLFNIESVSANKEVKYNLTKNRTFCRAHYGIAISLRDSTHCIKTPLLWVKRNALETTRRKFHVHSPILCLWFFLETNVSSLLRTYYTSPRRPNYYFGCWNTKTQFESLKTRKTWLWAMNGCQSEKGPPSLLDGLKKWKMDWSMSERTHLWCKNQCILFYLCIVDRDSLRMTAIYTFCYPCPPYERKRRRWHNVTPL